MPVGTVLNVDQLDILVSTTLGGTYSPVSDLDTISTSYTRPVNRRPVFMTTARSTTGVVEETLSISGVLSKGDTGQDILRAAAVANTTVFIELLFDGTNGWKQEANVSDKAYDADAGGDFQNYSFEIATFGPRTAVGAGMGDV